MTAKVVYGLFDYVLADANVVDMVINYVISDSILRLRYQNNKSINSGDVYHIVKIICFYSGI